LQLVSKYFSTTCGYNDKNRRIKKVTLNDTIESTNDNRVAKTTIAGTTTYIISTLKNQLSHF